MGEYMPIQNQRYTPLGRALFEAGMVDWGEEPIQPGGFFGRTNRPDGLSVRVFSRQSSDRTVSLFHITGRQPEEVRFSSYDHLAEYLPDNKRAALEEWANFIERRLGDDIRITGSRQFCHVALRLVEANVAELLEALLPLR